MLRQFLSQKFATCSKPTIEFENISFATSHVTTPLNTSLNNSSMIYYVAGENDVLDVSNKELKSSDRVVIDS